MNFPFLSSLVIGNALALMFDDQVAQGGLGEGGQDGPQPHL